MTTPENPFLLFRGKLLEIAKLYEDHIYPNRFDEVLRVKNLRVHIVVEKAESEADTKPIGGAASWDEQRAEQGGEL